MAGKGKILIIDDSTTNVVLLEAILNSKGYQVQTALSAVEALPMIEKEKPVLILLDLLMPRISGFEFMEKIRRNPETSDIPVIVVSAVTDEANKRRIMNTGVRDFIEKPIDIQALIQKVEKIVRIFTSGESGLQA